MIETVWNNSIATIFFNRPEKKNALTPPMLEKFIEAIGATHGARSLVIAGRGGVFCSGFDLDLCHQDSAALEALLRGLTGAILALRKHAAPVVVAAHGAAIAGGCALVGGADVALTNTEAKLGYPVVILGISPAVSAPFLTAAIGGGHARARLLEPRIVSGGEALHIGLVHECLDSAQDVLPRAMQIAESLAAKPRSAMAATKSWLDELDGATDTDVVYHALDASLSLVNSPEQRERLAKAIAR